MISRTLSLVALLSATSCYQTSVKSGKTPTGPEHQHRQWFLIAGAVDVSDPDGEECPEGMAESKSLQSGTDLLITMGLSVAGFITGAYACNLPDNPDAEQVRDYSTCVSVVSAIPPLLVASRTVRYRCAGAAPTKADTEAETE